MAREEQLSLFQEGGMIDEGGTKDPVSGNDVPTGSLKEEVRDDIPAQLSEGEFVMPADVVRYHGLDKMMALRDEAKMGLAKMEAMGQMGNSDEATLPDDVPFGLEDLELEEEPLEMQVGGVVPSQQPYGVTQATGPSYTTQQSQFANYAQQPTAPVVQQPTVQAPQTQGGYMPTFSQQAPASDPTQQTTFNQLMPSIETQSETREYRNEAGQVLYIPFVNGRPVYPIPTGFTEYRPEDIVDTTPTDPTAPTDTAQPVTVTDDNDDGGQSSLDFIEQERIQSQRIESTTNDLGVTGSRGLELGTALTALGFVVNPVGAIAGAIGKGIAEKAGVKVPSLFGDKTIGSREAMTELTPEMTAARERTMAITGQEVSGFMGTEIGDLDPVTGGIFGAHGVALDTKTGFASVSKTDPNQPFGNKSFNSFSTAKTFMSASVPQFLGGTGYAGGLPDAEQFSRLSSTGKANLSSYLGQIEERTDTPFAEGTTMHAVKTYFAEPIDVSAMSPLDATNAAAKQAQDKKAAAEVLTNAMANHVVENTDMVDTSLATAPHAQLTASVMAGVTTPKAAMDQGLTVDSFSSSTAAAKAGIGYSEYDENGNPTGAAPAGSGFSSTGKFSSGSADRNNNDNPNDDSSGAGFYGGSAQMEADLINSDLDDEAFWDEFESGTDDGGSEPDDGTYCCTASWKRKQMTISEVKELRKWHNEQSQVWRDGYDIWGKWVADNLVAKSDWSASVVKDIHRAFVKKEYTLKGLIGIIVITPGVYITGLYKKVAKSGRIFQPNS